MNDFMSSKFVKLGNLQIYIKKNTNTKSTILIKRYQIKFKKRGGNKSLSLMNLRRTLPDYEEHNVITLEKPTSDLKAKLLKEYWQVKALQSNFI